MYCIRFGDKSSSYSPWEFKNVETINVDRNKRSQTIGVPLRSSASTQVYDMEGMVKEFDIKIARYDDSEEISNWDMIYTTVNRDDSGKVYKGIDSMLSIIQCRHPYQLQIYWVPDANQVDDPGLKKTGKYNVSLTGYDVDFSNEEMSRMTLTLKLVERRG